MRTTPLSPEDRQQDAMYLTDPRVPDVSETWFRPSGGDTSKVRSCSAVYRSKITGELFRCPFWGRLTLVRGHWLCGTCLEKDPRRIVWPEITPKQAVLL